jgi:hypothetical protein
MSGIGGIKSYRLERGIGQGLGKAFPQKEGHLKREIQALSKRIEVNESLLAEKFNAGFHPIIGFAMIVDTFCFSEQIVSRGQYTLHFTDNEFFAEGDFFPALREALKEQFNFLVVANGFSQKIHPSLLTLRILRESGQKGIFFNRDHSYQAGISTTLPFAKLLELFSGSSLLATLRYDLEAFEIIPESFPALEHLQRIPGYTETQRATQGWHFGEIEGRYLLGLIYGDVLDFLVTLPGTPLGISLCEETRAK